MISNNKYLIPKSIDEAYHMSTSNPGSKYIAGGTDLMVNKFQGNEKTICLIDITKINNLKGVKKKDGFLHIGALENLESLKNYNEITTEFPMLIEAALSVGTPLIRKTATLGGNILCENRCIFYNQSEWWRKAAGYCLKCNGDICIATQGKKACFSELVSDTAPALIAMNAQLEIKNKKGITCVKLEDIYSGDGVVPLNISDSTIIIGIKLPLNKNFKTAFHKLRERETLEFTSLTTAVSVNKSNEIKIALSGVDPKPIVIEANIDDDKELLLKKAIKGAKAIDNDMYSRKYRKEMIRVFLERSFNSLNI